MAPLRKWTGTMWMVSSEHPRARVVAIPRPMEPRKWNMLGRDTMNIFSGAIILVSGEPVGSEDLVDGKLHSYLPICMPVVGYMNHSYFCGDSLWLRRLA